MSYHSLALVVESLFTCHGKLKSMQTLPRLSSLPVVVVLAQASKEQKAGVRTSDKEQ